VTETKLLKIWWSIAFNLNDYSDTSSHANF
jgi:hypothetical protein